MMDNEFEYRDSLGINDSIPRYTAGNEEEERRKLEAKASQRENSGPRNIIQSHAINPQLHLTGSCSPISRFTIKDPSRA